MASGIRRSQELATWEEAEARYPNGHSRGLPRRARLLHSIKKKTGNCCPPSFLKDGERDRCSPELATWEEAEARYPNGHSRGLPRRARLLHAIKKKTGNCCPPSFLKDGERVRSRPEIATWEEAEARYPNGHSRGLPRRARLLHSIKKKTGNCCPPSFLEDGERVGVRRLNPLLTNILLSVVYKNNFDSGHCPVLILFEKF